MNGMWIDAETVKEIYDFRRGKTTSEGLKEYFNELWGPVLKTPPLPPNRESMAKVLAGVTQPEPDPELEPLNHKQQMKTILAYHTADPRKHPLSPKAKSLCLLRQDEPSLTEGQAKFLNELWNTLIEELAGPPRPAAQ